MTCKCGRPVRAFLINPRTAIRLDPELALCIKCRKERARNREEARRPMGQTRVREVAR